ncbi:hypothetical protein FE257_007279 [Aspergillus nanangensis]|uniref:Uncharacterized protein n=1 Tax=Aspergillus nanangensis TaxID=2582783 RepID=A0AAD4CN25_ASPNN|nr:hypothetical protein FE257_007279 [Aspergillus nanangensis]
MEKKTNNVDAAETPEGSSSPGLARRRIARTVIGLSFLVLLLLLGAWSPMPALFSCHQRTRHFHSGFFASAESDTQLLMGSPIEPPVRQERRVPLEAHIMSKCPDARDCLQKLVVPAMEQVNDMVDFDMSFIANVHNRSSGIDCKHGPGECVGDVLILCAQSLPFHPDEDPDSTIRMPTIRSLGFANCLIGSYERIPDRTLVEDCALKHGIDFEALNECASRQEDDPDRPDLSGPALLRKSALYNEQLGVKTSCTLRLDEEVWCVRDGGVWKDCAKGGEGSKVEALVDEVKKLAREESSAWPRSIVY